MILANIDKILDRGPLPPARKLSDFEPMNPDKAYRFICLHDSLMSKGINGALIKYLERIGAARNCGIGLVRGVGLVINDPSPERLSQFGTLYMAPRMTTEVEVWRATPLVHGLIGLLYGTGMGIGGLEQLHVELLADGEMFLALCAMGCPVRYEPNSPDNPSFLCPVRRGTSICTFPITNKWAMSIQLLNKRIKRREMLNAAGLGAMLEEFMEDEFDHDDDDDDDDVEVIREVDDHGN